MRPREFALPDSLWSCVGGESVQPVFNRSNPDWTAHPCDIEVPPKPPSVFPDAGRAKVGAHRRRSCGTQGFRVILSGGGSEVYWEGFSGRDFPLATVL